VVMNVSNKSFVNGPVGKVGDDLFTFPTGAVVTAGGEGFYAPVRISAPSGITSSLVAEYKHEAQAFGTTLGAGLESVGDCDYWTITSVTSELLDVEIELDNSQCSVEDVDQLVLTTWNGVEWQPATTDKLEYDALTEKGVLAAFGITLYNPVPVALGKKPKNSKIYPLVKKKLDAGYYHTVRCHLKFKYDEEYNDADGSLAYKIYDNANQLVYSNINFAVPISYGINLCDVDLGLLSTGYYVLEVTNQKEEKWYLRFKHTLNSSCN
jgi:hypothetical protein